MQPFLRQPLLEQQLPMCVSGSQIRPQSVHVITATQKTPILPQLNWILSNQSLPYQVTFEIITKFVALMLSSVFDLFSSTSLTTIGQQPVHRFLCVEQGSVLKHLMKTVSCDWLIQLSVF